MKRTLGYGVLFLFNKTVHLSLLTQNISPKAELYIPRLGESKHHGSVKIVLTYGRNLQSWTHKKKNGTGEHKKRTVKTTVKVYFCVASLKRTGLLFGISFAFPTL